MRFSTLASLALAAAPFTIAAPVAEPRDLSLQEGELLFAALASNASENIQELLKEAEESLKKRAASAACTFKTIVVRKELYVPPCTIILDTKTDK